MAITFFKELPSTNQYCELLDLHQIEEFSVFCAESQTQGIGQRGNHWESQPGQNLTFSIILKPQLLPAANQFRITQAISLAVVDHLRTEIPHLDASIAIKWPNDIYVGLSKICGILTSNRLLGNAISASIVGIGLNINQTEFSSWIPNPTSLKFLDGQTRPVHPILETLVSCIKSRMQQLCVPNPDQTTPDQLNDEYLSRLLFYQTQHAYLYQNQAIQATIVGVNQFGHLQLTQSNGPDLSCQMKEISFIL